MRAREYSLRWVLVLALTLSCLFPLLSVSTISYVSLRNLQQNSVVNSIRAAVRQNRSQLDTMVEVLDSITQLAVMEFVSSGEIEQLVGAKSYFGIFRAAESIKARLNLLSFANPDIGVIAMYDLDAKEVITQSTAIRDPPDFAAVPPLLRRNTFIAFGPRPTLQKDRADLVIAAARLIPNSLGRQVYLYFEIGSRSLGTILARGQYGIAATHLVVTAEGTLCYSEDEASFRPGTAFAPPAGEGGWGVEGRWVVFSEPGSAGWRLAVAFERRTFDAERMQWLAGLLAASFLSLAASLLIAFFIWRIIYVPLGMLRTELEAVGRGPSQAAARPVRLREHRYLMDRVAAMRERITALIEELKANEAKKRRLEVERLLFQINPHFLYNTLNNVQWLARINGQQEISDMVADLTRVLHYNLRRTGEMSTVRDEIQMLGSYVAIRRRRLDLRIDLDCSVEPDSAEVPIPRFILQPLVENAIEHGLREALGIEVISRRLAGGRLSLQVRDNGVGMGEETLRAVLAGDTDEAADGDGVGTAGPRAGLGIRYVRSLIAMVYGERGRIAIESLPGRGTTVTIDLPDGSPT